MKATMSRDGNKRFTIRVEYRISIGDLTEIAAQMMYEKELGLKGAKPLTKSNIMQEVRKSKQSCGYETYIDDEAYEYKDDARDIVEKLFPELL